jgi:hypothetical protein
MKDKPHILLALAGRLLPRGEGEAVLGDLVESGEGGWRGSLKVFDLAIRRQGALWRDWKPWLAALAVALPSSFILMGLSLSLCVVCQREFAPEAPWQMTAVIPGAACRLLLLVGSAWSGGYLIVSLSRRTLWASLLACFAPCLFCLSRFRIAHFSRFSLLLFVLPAAWGICRGFRAAPLKPVLGVALALFVTTMTFVTGESAPPELIGRAQFWLLQSMFAAPACAVAVMALYAQKREVHA